MEFMKRLAFEKKEEKDFISELQSSPFPTYIMGGG